MIKSLKIVVGAAFCFFYVSCTPTNTQSASSNLDNRLFGIWQDTTTLTTNGYLNIYSFSDDGRMVYYRVDFDGNYSNPDAYEWWTVDNMLYRVEINSSYTRVNDYEVNGNWLQLNPASNYSQYLKKQ